MAREMSCGGCYLIPEFQPQVLNLLRQPLETGEVAIARANHRITYPARFQLVAAMNSCRCGHALDPGYACSRQPAARCVGQYQARLSGPLLDRIDLMIEVPAVNAADLLLPPAAEGSAEVAARVAAARHVQVKRYAELGLPHVFTNAAAPGHVIEDMARPDTAGMVLLREASERLNLSARGFYRILKLARTIADLDGAATVGRPHLAEARRIALARRRSCARPRTAAAASMRSLIATHHFLPKASQFREIFYFSGEFWEFFSSILPCLSAVFFLFYSRHFALHHFMERRMPKFPRSVAILFGALGLCAAPLVVLPVSSASAAALTAADTDKDGTIDLTEAKAAASAEFDKLDKDKDGTLDLKEVAHHVSKANFSAANPDNDKTLTKDEYLALVAKLFQAADKEGDGTIDFRSCIRRPELRSIAPSADLRPVLNSRLSGQHNRKASRTRLIYARSLSFSAASSDARCASADAGRRRANLCAEGSGNRPRPRRGRERSQIPASGHHEPRDSHAA